jgi:hypothetical protein
MPILRQHRPPSPPPFSQASPGTPEARSLKERSVGPRGDSGSALEPGRDTCAARHLRREAGGRSAFPSTPPRSEPRAKRHGTARREAAARTSVPARPASYRRARRLLISVAPALPPPPAAVAVAAAAGRDTTSSGLHRHVRRAANCIVGGKGWGGGGGEGEGEKEEDPLRGGGRGRGGSGKVVWGRERRAP